MSVYSCRERSRHFLRRSLVSGLSGGGGPETTDPVHALVVGNYWPPERSISTTSTIWHCGYRSIHGWDLHVDYIPEKDVLHEQTIRNVKPLREFWLTWREGSSAAHPRHGSSKATSECTAGTPGLVHLATHVRSRLDVEERHEP